MRSRHTSQVKATRWELSRGVLNCPVVSRIVATCREMSPYVAMVCDELSRTPPHSS